MCPREGTMYIQNFYTECEGNLSYDLFCYLKNPRNNNFCTKIS